MGFFLCSVSPCNLYGDLAVLIQQKLLLFKHLLNMQMEDFFLHLWNSREYHKKFDINLSWRLIISLEQVAHCPLHHKECNSKFQEETGIMVRLQMLIAQFCTEHCLLQYEETYGNFTRVGKVKWEQVVDSIVVIHEEKCNFTILVNRTEKLYLFHLKYQKYLNIFIVAFFFYHCLKKNYLFVIEPIYMINVYPR